MNRLLAGAVVLLALVGTAHRLLLRQQEEHDDRRLVMVVDWSEVRSGALRQAASDHELLERLKRAGASAILLSAATVRDYLWRSFTFSNRADAEAVRRQLQARGVVGVSLQAQSGRYRLLRRVGGWDPLEELEVGYDPELIDQARRAGLQMILRVNQDPWLSKAELFESLERIAEGFPETGFLLNTDEIPGGPDALSEWSALVAMRRSLHLLFEFRPTKSALRLAARKPMRTYRAHTIPANELKDLTPPQEQARWRRAVDERSCRFLLFHMSPADSLTSFLETLDATRQALTRRGWEIAWPSPRLTWQELSSIQRVFAPVAALFLAICTPLVALRAARGQKPWVAFWLMAFLTLLGGAMTAAVADNPLIRVQVVPFRGIKLAFVAAWVGSFLSLYSWKEIRQALALTVSRQDLVGVLLVLAVIGYVLMRTGNASAGWKPGWEQGVRDRLEDLLVARPRFKEFAIGYPMLLVGLVLRSNTRPKPFWQEGRLWMTAGMIGPISTVNTFCHLHSPLYLAFWRSVNGMLIGFLFGVILLLITQWGVRRL